MENLSDPKKPIKAINLLSRNIFSIKQVQPVFKRIKLDDRALANVVVMLILVAITVALSATFVQVSQSISEKMMVSGVQPASVIVRGSQVTVSNPTALSINLSRLTLLVDGNLTEIHGDNNNGVWEPFEPISFSIDDRNGDGIITIALYFDGEEMFHVTYIKPVELERDRQYPQLLVNHSAANGIVTLDIESSDDIVVASLQIFMGDRSGEHIYKSEGLIDEKDIPELMKEIRNFRETGVKGHTILKYSNVHKSVEIPANSINFTQAKYVIVKVRDITGKTSSRVLTAEELLPDTPPTVSITAPSTVWTTGSNAEVSYSVYTADERGVVEVCVDVDGSIINCTYPNNFSVSFTNSINLHLGVHILNATAKDTSGKTAMDSVTVEVRRDNPPSVHIIQPNEGEVFYVSSSSHYTVTVKATASDDRGVKKVEFYVDCIMAGEDSHPPYQMDVDLSPGKHTIEAVAVDIEDQTARDSVNVTVRDNPPTVSVTAPTNVTTGKVPKM